MKKNKLLLCSEGFSIFGGWIDFIVILSIAAFKFNINSFEISVLSAGILLPSIVFVKYIGVLSNSKNTINYLMISLLIRAIIGIIIIFCESLLIFSFFVVLRATFNSFNLPAIQTIAANNVSESDRNSYYTSLNIVNSISKILAPSLGGIIALVYDSNYSLILSSIFTVISFIIIFCIRNSLNIVQTERKNEKKLSLKTSESERKMWNLVLPIICIFFLFVFMINNQLPVILKDLKMNEASLGLLISSSALGNILYGFYNLKLIKNTSIDSLKKLKNSTFSIMIIFILIGILINSSILSISYLMILFFVSGVFSSKFSIYLNIYLSTYMLENFGQIISKLQAIQNLIILFAPFLGAFILIKYNPSILFITCGVLGLVSMLILNILIKYSLFKNLNNVET